MKRKWLWLALPLILAAIVIPLSQKQRDFIHLFERVPGTNGCGVFDNSLWISPREVVCLMPPPPPPQSPVMIGFLGVASLEAVDVATGAHRKLGATPPNHDISGSFGVIVSPDGKWILWPGMVYDAKLDGYTGDRWNAMTLDGKKFVQRPRVADSISGRGLAWLPDSRGWVEVCVINRASNGRTNGVTLRVCSLDSDTVVKIDVPQAKNANKTFAINAAGEAVIGCDGPSGLRVVTVPLIKSGAVRTHDVPLPAQFGGGKTIPRSLISPRGDRICWTFHDTTTQTESLWLSDINGVTFESLTLGVNDISDPPQKLHWTPDGQALSCWRPTPGNPRGGLSLYLINIPHSLKLKP